MTTRETQAIEDAVWYLGHGNAQGALAILRDLRTAAPVTTRPVEPPAERR